jgi:hypothetical protein
MRESVRQRLSGDPERLRQLALQGAKGPLPHAESLRSSFGEAPTDLSFSGGTPEARWACSALGISAFSHGGVIVSADASPSVEVIGHEVAHHLQGAGGAVGSVASVGSGAEQEAAGAGQAVASGQSVEVSQGAQPGVLHGFPGHVPLPVTLPVPDFIGDIVEEVVAEVVERAVDAAVGQVTGAVDSVVDGVQDGIAALGDGIAAVGDGVMDGLDLRENEDLMDFEEDVAAGDIDAPTTGVAAVFSVVRQVRAGETVSAEARAAAQATVTGLSNEDMRKLLQALDDAGLLMEVSRVVFGGTPAAGETDMFEVAIATWRFWNASDDIAADVQRANEIYEPHNIHLQTFGARNISKTEVEGIVGHGVPNTFGLDRSKTDGTFTDADMVAVVNALGVGQIISGLWVPTVVNDAGNNLSGTSMHTENMTHSANIGFVATDYSGADTFAHEVGHILTREGHVAGDSNNLMDSGRTRDKEAHGTGRLTDEQVTEIRADVLGYLRS